MLEQAKLLISGKMLFNYNFPWFLGTLDTGSLIEVLEPKALNFHKGRCCDTLQIPIFSSILFSFCLLGDFGVSQTGDK